MASYDPLDEIREMLKAVVDATTAVIYIKDVDGRYVLINRRFGDLFHVSHDVARGKKDHEIFPAETANQFRANDLDVQRRRATVEFEEYVPHDDGEHTYISIKFPLFRENGEVYAVCGISTDITARKRSRRASGRKRSWLPPRHRSSGSSTSGRRTCVWRTNASRPRWRSASKPSRASSDSSRPRARESGQSTPQATPRSSIPDSPRCSATSPAR